MLCQEKDVSNYKVKTPACPVNTFAMYLPKSGVRQTKAAVKIKNCTHWLDIVTSRPKIFRDKQENKRDK